MNTFQLSCFIRVAETLNFARAAEQLHVTQPAVTQQIQSLEKELIVNLFKRITRTVKITVEGLVFLNVAHRMIGFANRAKTRFEDPSFDRGIQFLSLGCRDYSLMAGLPQIIKTLLKKYPNLHPQLQMIPAQHLYRLLDEEDLDAVIGFQERGGKNPSIFYKEIGKVPVVCVCGEDSPLAGRKFISVEEMKKEKLVLCDPMRLPPDIGKLQGQIMDNRSLMDFYFCSMTESAAVFAEAGLGIAVMPELAVPISARLAKIPIEGIEPVSAGIYYKSVQEKSVLKSLIRILEEEWPL